MRFVMLANQTKYKISKKNGKPIYSEEVALKLKVSSFILVLVTLD